MQFGMKQWTVLAAATVLCAGTTMRVEAQAVQTDAAPTEVSTSAAPESSLPGAPSTDASADTASKAVTQGATPGTLMRPHRLMNLDLAASATGQFTTPLTSDGPATQGTTGSVGFLMNARFHPVSWAGLEVNYGYNHYAQRYSNPQTGLVNGSVQASQHEATAGYVFHIKTKWVQPFVVLGGGAVDFLPTQGHNQWRGAGMYEVGLDFVAQRHPQIGFRIQQHALLYKAPDFYNNTLRSNGWVHQSAPSIGVFYRF